MQKQSKEEKKTKKGDMFLRNQALGVKGQNEAKSLK